MLAGGLPWYRVSVVDIMAEVPRGTASFFSLVGLATGVPSSRWVKGQIAEGGGTSRQEALLRTADASLEVCEPEKPQQGALERDAPGSKSSVVIDSDLGGS